MLNKFVCEKFSQFMKNILFVTILLFSGCGIFEGDIYEAVVFEETINSDYIESYTIEMSDGSDLGIFRTDVFLTFHQEIDTAYYIPYLDAVDVEILIRTRNAQAWLVLDNKKRHPNGIPSEGLIDWWGVTGRLKDGTHLFTFKMVRGR